MEAYVIFISVVLFFSVLSFLLWELDQINRNKRHMVEMDYRNKLRKL